MPLDNPILFVPTTDAKRSRAFYEKVLRLPFVSEDAFAIVFKVGKLTLRIQKVPAKPDVPYTVLGWKVADLEKEVQVLAKNGVGFSFYDGLDQDRNGIWQSPSGARIAWFTDPDKNTLSLTEFR